MCKCPFATAWEKQMSLRVGIIGCGNIAPTYLRNSAGFSDFVIVACADEQAGRAEAIAAEFGLRSCTYPEMLADSDIEIILNLTPAVAHAETTRAALRAGKHVYSEKPLATEVNEGRELAALAKSVNRLGIAPDTFMGPMVQQARDFVDSGAIGEVIHGVAAFMHGGMEAWHPWPVPFFRRGGGPMLDIGPYAVAALVEILGPVTSVVAVGRIGRAQRTIEAPHSPQAGETFEVEVPTTVHAILQFATGAQVTLFGSFDTAAHDIPTFELFGTSGTLSMPSPHVFSGELVLTRSNGEAERFDTTGEEFGVPNTNSHAGKVADYRGLGLADMAHAIESGHVHRASAGRGLHVLEILGGIDASVQSGERVMLAPCLL